MVLLTFQIPSKLFLNECYVPDNTFCNYYQVERLEITWFLQCTKRDRICFTFKMIPTYRLHRRQERDLESCQAVIVTPTFDDMIWPWQNGCSDWHKAWFATYTLTSEYKQTSFSSKSNMDKTLIISPSLWHTGQNIVLVQKQGTSHY